MNAIQSLNEYVTSVLDTNKDGRVNFRDLIDLFPNSAIAIAVIFVDLVVAVAEYRVYDVGLHLTGGNVYKALGFVLVSAVPFYLGQVFWLYPVANGIQKVIAVVMVAQSLYTSWEFGTADLSQTYDVAAIVSMVVNMTAAYIVIVLGYILFDDGIKAHRLKKQTEGRAAQERDYQKIARAVLRELAETQRLQQETEREFGDPDLVRKQIERLRGTKPAKPPAPAFQPMTANAAETEGREPVFTPAGDNKNNNRPQK